MNDRERELIRLVCEGDIRKSQRQAKIVLEGLTAKKDEQFKNHMLRKLDAKGPSLIELPYNLQQLLVAEDMTDFPEARFILREEEAEATRRTLALYKASGRLAEMGIPYLPALILHGESGTGKTMLARYIAHKADLPFVYVRFSNLVDSHLGQTQTNVARVFDYARNVPCVLCFDEVDAIGMARGQKDDVGEMNRVVIALMQELDRLPNNVIIIATTNRFDRLDPALIRRFPLQHEVIPLNIKDTEHLARKFFNYSGVDCSTWISNWCAEKFPNTATPASTVIRECTEHVVNTVLEDEGIGVQDYGGAT